MLIYDSRPVEKRCACSSETRVGTNRPHRKSSERRTTYVNPR
jgi:hypothetical protein